MEVGQLYESPFNSLAPAGPEVLFAEEKITILESVFDRLESGTRPG